MPTDIPEGDHHLADWPSRRLVEEFILDEERHAAEIGPFLGSDSSAADWNEHLRAVLAARGGWLGERESTPLPTGFIWRTPTAPTDIPRPAIGRLSAVLERLQRGSEETPIVRSWLVDPKTDPQVIRVMVYVWLMMEMDAVDYLATVFFDTPARRSTCTTTWRGTSGTNRGTASSAFANFPSSASTS